MKTLIADQTFAMKNSNKQECTRKTYNFKTYSSASLVAKHAIEMGGNNVRIRPKSSGFCVSFSSSWNVELCVFSLDVPCTKGYRTGIKWHGEEEDFLIDAYMCWHSIDEIADKVHRSPNSVAAALTRLGYLERVNSLLDSWNDAWDEPANDELLFNSKVLSNRDHLYLAEVKILPPERAYSAGNISIAELTQVEETQIFKLLMWFDRWGSASKFSLEAGDALRAFRLARQGGHMLLALKALNSEPNLSPKYSDQRDMLSAFFRKKIIDELPLAIERWVAAAKSRDPGYPHKHGERPTFPIDVVLGIQIKCLPDTLRSLCDDNEELKSLVKKGNKLAACFLADIQWQGMWSDGNYRLYADDEARKVQDDYWPTKHEIENLLRSSLPFDEKIAQKLSHSLTSEHVNHSYYKYHLLMSHEHYPESSLISNQDESDNEYSGQPVCLYCGHPVDKLCGVCSGCTVRSKGSSINPDYDGISSEMYEDNLRAEHESEVNSEILEEFFSDADANVNSVENGWYCQ